MKRIMIMLLIACSASITVSAQQKKANVGNTPYNVKALFNSFLKSWGAPSDEVYSVVKNPNTNQIESSVKITYFVANVNTGSVRQNMSVIGEAFKKDESRSYQLLHLAPTNKESFSLSVVNENGQRTNYLIRAKEPEEMWLLCAKNPENPKLRDAYAIKWTYNADKSKALGTIYQITSLRPDYFEQSMSAGTGIFSEGQNVTTKTFRIDGRVGEDLTDSLYVVYMAPTADSLNKLKDNAFVAYMPVVGKRFSFSVELDKPMVGRIRTVMPDGSLCQLWTNLDFVPGETYRIITHNGYYDADNDYERRVGRWSGKSLLDARQIAGVDDVVVEELPDTVAQDSFIVIDHVEMLPKKNPFDAKAIPLPSIPTLPSIPDSWKRNSTPQQEAEVMRKGMAMRMSREALKMAYSPFLLDVVKNNDPFNLGKTDYFDDDYKNIVRLNKELDKNFHSFVKAIKALNMPQKELVEGLLDGYRETLKIYTEQNKIFNEIYQKTGKLTKPAQKAQKYVISLTEKYTKEASEYMLEQK